MNVTVTVGAIYALLVWVVGRGSAGADMSGSTDIGTGIIYTCCSSRGWCLPRRRDGSASAWIASWSDG